MRVTSWQILKKMKKFKTDHASFLSNMIRENPSNKTPEQIIPKAILECFKELDSHLEKGLL